MTVSAQDIKPFKLTLAMASVGGAHHAISEGLGESLRRCAPGSRVTIMPGDIAGNNVAVHNREVDLAVGFAPMTLLANMGQEPFKTPMRDLRGIMALNPMYYTPNGTQKAGISSFEDIKTKKTPLTAVVNRRSTLQEIITREVLKAYGITYEDIASWGGKIHFMTGGEARALLADGHIQFMLGSVSAVPEPRLIETSATQPMMILEVRKDIREMIEKKYGLKEAIIPKASYKFMTKDIHTFEIANILYCSEALPVDTVYNLTKCFDKSRLFLARVHSAIKDLTPETMSDIKGVPLHEGAKKYYREIGVKVP